ncbi:Ankyrin repeat domain-containing protein 50 [Durusdinium trenchii]|uniref:Ankyrin repeat domain-containing protein 50 n=1 Tax=Durusdinium trenchii TaxID=1381693 RepID=A0ABP0RSS6_9DINO
MAFLCPSDGDGCSYDECRCANASHVRELVNVSLDGQPCYACEPPRLPACTEATDQCTPEACACANSRTHVKYNASTVDGSPCFYCEPIGGYWSFGRNEMALVLLALLLVALWRSGQRRRVRDGRSAGSLRLPRRSAENQQKAIRVSQEPLRFYEQVLQVIEDVIDTLIDGACELVSWPFRPGLDDVSVKSRSRKLKSWIKTNGWDLTSVSALLGNQNLRLNMSELVMKWIGPVLRVAKHGWVMSSTMTYQGGRDTCMESQLDLLAELPTDLPRELSLVLAARQGQHHLLEALLDSQVDPNATDPHGGTALLRAVQLGITARPSIEALLKAKADVSRASSLGETPLGEAAGQGPPELVARLLEANTPSADCLRTSLEKAAQLGNRQTTRMLLSGLAAAKAVPSAEALIGWVNCGDAEMVLELLKGRTDVNQAREHDGATAVLVAASSPNPQLIQLLCAQLADVNCSDRSHRTPLAAASAVGGDAAVGALLAANAQVDGAPLVAAALAGRTSTAKLLLESGAASNARDLAGRTPLASAAASGSLQLCQALLLARADPQIRSGAGKGAPPLAIAVAAQHISLVEELLRARADVDALSERGQTPLMLAAAAGHQEMSEKLLEAGAQVNDCSEDGKTALILAAGIGSPICQLLLSHRADLQHRSATGISALHTAAANGHEELCRVARRAGYGALAELLETGSS